MKKLEMKKIIKLTESDLNKIVHRILKEQYNWMGAGTPPSLFSDKYAANLTRKDKSKPNINPKKLKLGDGGKSHPEQVKDVKDLQQKLMDLGLLNLKTKVPTGYFGTLTQNALNRYNTGTDTKQPSKDPDKESPIVKKPANTDYGDCIGLNREQCAKISASQKVDLLGAGGDQCAAYVTKCLSEYDKLFKTGDAWWAAAYTMSKGGTERYNLFKTDIDWKKLYNELKDNKITKKVCMNYFGKQGSDPSVKEYLRGYSGVQKIAVDNLPQKSSVNISSLKPGDIVGLWHKSTDNKGRAFCERLVNNPISLDDNGNVKKQAPFTYNTHVGFVTAVKDGVPIIAHNVHGTISALPATKALSRNDDDMIVWAVSDPDVEREVAKRMKQNSASEYQSAIQARP